MPTEPTTPVRIPKVATTYTPTTQDPDMRSNINGILLRDGHVTKIQETLLHALNASTTNWPDLVQKHALALLRSGDCTTFPALMARVLADIKADTVEARGKSGTSGFVNGGGKSLPAVNGEKAGSNREKEKDKGKDGRGEDGVSLAVPDEVLAEGIRITRESLESFIDVGE